MCNPFYERGKNMKETELRLVSELMKNSRRSDRQLARAIGVSQPTISRMIQKLEKQGIIKEYAMIPDFAKLGYGLLAVTFVKYRKDLTPEKLAEAEWKLVDSARGENSPEVVIADRGIGLGYDAVFISYEKDYSAFTHLVDRIKVFKHLETTETQSFIIDLNDKLHYRSLTYSTLANHLLSTQDKHEEKSSPTQDR